MPCATAASGHAGSMVRRRPPPQPVPRPLRQALRDAVRGDQDGWLCLPAGEASTLETDAFFWSAFDEEGTAEEDTVEVNGRWFQATLDGATVHDICTGAAALEDPQSDEVLLEALTYYFEHDAFLPERGYEPPPWDEIQRNLDLEFWEALGEEEAGTQCRREGCEDGTIRHSVLCRRHHFESIRNRPSPFETASVDRATELRKVHPPPVSPTDTERTAGAEPGHWSFRSDVVRLGAAPDLYLRLLSYRITKRTTTIPSTKATGTPIHMLLIRGSSSSCSTSRGSRIRAYR